MTILETPGPPVKQVLGWLAERSGDPTSQLSETDLVHLVLGRKLEVMLGARPVVGQTDPVSAPPATSAAAADAAAAGAVTVTGVTGKIAQDVHLSVEPGEILGVTGLEASSWRFARRRLRAVPFLSRGPTRMSCPCCDRILVFREGRIQAELREDLPADSIVEATFSLGRRPRLRKSSMPAS